MALKLVEESPADRRADSLAGTFSQEMPSRTERGLPEFFSAGWRKQSLTLHYE